MTRSEFLKSLALSVLSFGIIKKVVGDVKSANVPDNKPYQIGSLHTSLTYALVFDYLEVKKWKYYHVDYLIKMSNKTVYSYVFEKTYTFDEIHTLYPAHIGYTIHPIHTAGVVQISRRSTGKTHFHQLLNEAITDQK